jgi:hypothetical protein
MAAHSGTAGSVKSVSGEIHMSPFNAPNMGCRFETAARRNTPFAPAKRPGDFRRTLRVIGLLFFIRISRATTISPA